MTWHMVPVGLLSWKWIATGIGALFVYTVLLIVLLAILNAASRADDEMERMREGRGDE